MTKSAISSRTSNGEPNGDERVLKLALIGGEKICAFLFLNRTDRKENCLLEASLIHWRPSTKRFNLKVKNSSCPLTKLTVYKFCISRVKWCHQSSTYFYRKRPRFRPFRASAENKLSVILTDKKFTQKTLKLQSMRFFNSSIEWTVNSRFVFRHFNYL